MSALHEPHDPHSGASATTRAHRPSLAELDRTCQKLDHRRLGNWMARRVARPAALCITWLVAPWGVSAHAATLAAWGSGLAAAAAFGWGSPTGWLIGAVLLQVWYLLDHVDGQLARLRKVESLDGVALDYLMHHSLNLAVPCGVGWGLAVASLDAAWAALGLVWGGAMLLAGLANDVRYKAFVQRLKRVEGQLAAVGGGGGRPAPATSMPRRPLAFAGWLARKLNEGHVVMNMLALLAAIAWWRESVDLAIVRVCVGVALAASLGVVVRTVWRLVSVDDAEREFAAWFRAQEGTEIVFRDGWWCVEATSRAHADRDV